MTLTTSARLGHFYEAACQSTAAVRGSDRVSGIAPVSAYSSFNQLRGARANGSPSPRRVKLFVARLKMTARSFTLLYALDVARAVPAHEKIRGGVAHATGRLSTAATCPQRADSSSLTT